MKDIIENILSPFVNPFIIEVDGSAQTSLYNNGRVGFFVERKFGIIPNNSQKPDWNGYEIKTLRYGKPISIGTMPEDEFRNIRNSPSHYWTSSNPYKKMKQSIFVFYENVDSNDVYRPQYVLKGWSIIDFEQMPEYIKGHLQLDYQNICEQIKHLKNRDSLIDDLKDNGGISGHYLKLGYKGDRNYIYPAWSFLGKFSKQIGY